MPSMRVFRSSRSVSNRTSLVSPTGEGALRAFSAKSRSRRRKTLRIRLSVVFTGSALLAATNAATLCQTTKSRPSSDRALSCCANSRSSGRPSWRSRQLLAGYHKGVDLRWGQVIEAEGRYFRNAEFAAGERSAVPGNHLLSRSISIGTLKSKVRMPLAICQICFLLWRCGFAGSGFSS